jgi:hypothetical protein
MKIISLCSNHQHVSLCSNHRHVSLCSNHRHVSLCSNHRHVSLCSNHWHVSLCSNHRHVSATHVINNKQHNYKYEVSESIHSTILVKFTVKRLLYRYTGIIYIRRQKVAVLGVQCCGWCTQTIHVVNCEPSQLAMIYMAQWTNHANMCWGLNISVGAIWPTRTATAGSIREVTDRPPYSPDLALTDFPSLQTP